MEVGSLVEKINNNISRWAEVFNYKIPVMGKVYTIRDIEHYKKGDAIFLEEIWNCPIPVKQSDGSVIFREVGFDINNFRELMPPTSISIDEILKQEIEA